MLLKVAANSDQKQRHAAMITMNGKPVAISINKSRNNPRYVKVEVDGKADIYSIHAERAAIRQAGNVEGGVLYVVRRGPGGCGKLSLPCNNCMKAIIKAGIKRVFFTTDDGIGMIKV